MKYPMGRRSAQLGHFIKTKSYKLGQQIISERVNREFTNFHLLRWRATKVAKVVVCTRSPILISLGGRGLKLALIPQVQSFLIQNLD